MTTSKPRPTVMVVDDVPQTLTQIHGLLRGAYAVKVATGGAEALHLLQTAPLPDLILLDILMPEVDGYMVCRQVKADPRTRDIPVIFLTALTDDVDEEMGLGLGAVDFLSKPLSPSIMLARIATQLALKASADFLRDKNRFLEQEVVRRMEEADEVQDSMLRMLASLAAMRDGTTDHAHLLRVQQMLPLLLEPLAGQPQFEEWQGPEAVALLVRAATLYDIGMAYVPDAIVRRHGALSSLEFETMAAHAKLGRQAIERVEHRLGRTVPLLLTAKELASHHHERWDGTGYPLGLAGERIPACARLLAVVDCYVAMTSARPHRPARSHAEALAAIVDKGRGLHFDPAVVDALRLREKDVRGLLPEPAARRGSKGRTASA